MILAKFNIFVKISLVPPLCVQIYPDKYFLILLVIASYLFTVATYIGGAEYIMVIEDRSM
jgi:hypothetical protein